MEVNNILFKLPNDYNEIARLTLIYTRDKLVPPISSRNIFEDLWRPTEDYKNLQRPAEVESNEKK